MIDDAKLPEATPTAPGTAPQSIQIPVDASKMQTIYCNFFRMSLSSSTEEILMDLGVHSGIMAGPNTAEPIQLTQRLVLNPFVAKRVLESLRQIMGRYEQMFGVVETDPQRRLRPGIRPSGQI
jgi:hypothetical protein